MVSDGATLVEREPELLLLESVVGGGASALIEGPAGIGKTALLSRALRQAPPATTVAFARSSLLEQHLSGGVILQLLSREVGSNGDQLFAGPAQAARALFEPDGRALPEGIALFHALHELCVNIGRHKGLILAVDDAQWADQLSLEFLGYLMRRAGGSRMSVMLTVRTGESGPHQLLLQDLANTPDTVIVAPAALSQEGSREVVRRALSSQEPAEVGDDWWERSGGIPLYLVELARHHKQGLGASAPDSVVRLVQNRLERLPDSARQVAVGLSILGSAARHIDIAELADMSVDEVLQQLDELERVELIVAETCSFAHPVLAEAVLSSVPAGELTRLRTGAARLLHQDAPLRAAAQMAALGPSARTGEDWAAATLFAASTNAMERAGVTEAAHYLQRALSEPADNALRFRILLDLGRLKAQLRDPDALHDFDLATSLAANPLERARTALLHGEALFHFGELDQCSRVCLAAVAELGDTHRELALQLHAMAFNADGVTGSRRDRPAAFFAEVKEPKTAGERAVLTHVVADVAARGSWPASEVRRVGLRALDGGVLLDDVGAASPTYIFCGTALAWADEFSAVIDLAERGLEIGERRGSRMAIAYSSALHAGVLLRAGRLKDAEQSAARVVDELADADPMSYGIAVGWLVQTLVEQGRVAEARIALDDSGLDGPLPALGTIAFLMLARGHLYLAEGDADAAVREFSEVGDISRTSLYPNPAALAWRSASAMALLALDRGPEAHALAAEELSLAREFGSGRAIAIALYVLAMVSEDENEAIALLEESVAEAHRAGALLEQVRSLVALGSHRVSADHPSARQLLQDAMDLADRCGASLLGDEAKELIRKTGARPRRQRFRGAGSLTHQERRVTRLASTGRLNREIADDLFISIGTVETHLTNAYKKLGVSSRSELAAALE